MFDFGQLSHILDPVSDFAWFADTMPLLLPLGKRCEAGTGIGWQLALQNVSTYCLPYAWLSSVIMMTDLANTCYGVRENIWQWATDGDQTINLSAHLS